MGRYVEWKPFYTVGNTTLDAEHHRLLGLIDDLYEAAQPKGDPSRFQGILQDLADYTVTHFDHEEQVMRQCGYPKLDAHKIMHEEMRRRANEFREHPEKVMASDVLEFLKVWWTRHIQNQDKAYSPYLDAIKPQPAGVK
jgi:hemerythrin